MLAIWRAWAVSWADCFRQQFCRQRVAVIDQRPRTLEDVAALLLGHVGAISGARHDAANQHSQTPAGVAATAQRDQ